MREPAALFRALADETRMQMVALLRAHGELCVCDLENVLGISQSKASRHLRYLLNAGLLEDRREAIWSFYQIARNLDPTQLSVIEALPNLLNPETMSDLEQRLAAWFKKKSCGTDRSNTLPRTRIAEVPDER